MAAAGHAWTADPRLADATLDAEGSALAAALALRALNNAGLATGVEEAADVSGDRMRYLGGIEIVDSHRAASYMTVHEVLQAGTGLSVEACGRLVTCIRGKTVGCDGAIRQIIGDGCRVTRGWQAYELLVLTLIGFGVRLSRICGRIWNRQATGGGTWQVGRRGEEDTHDLPTRYHVWGPWANKVCDAMGRIEGTSSLWLARARQAGRSRPTYTVLRCTRHTGNPLA